MPATVIVAKCAAEVPVEAVGGRPTTVYWDICGLGQCPRYALELAGVDYVDVRVDAGDASAPDYKAIWLQQAKPGTTAAGLHFSNLPYYLDADATDLDNAITGPCYRDFAALRPFFLDVLPEKLDAWAARLGGGPYVTGASLSIGDLKIYETAASSRSSKAQGTACSRASRGFVARVDVDRAPTASPAFLERPLNNPHAQFR
ncbi:glutathione transferase [Aureococcus anophagefferens]|nr:glutathione transferase [Aureococcus anophagefferens]